MIGAAAGDTGRQVRFQVDGMDCASCAAKIEIVVRRRPGVRDVTVNITSGLVDVTTTDDGPDDGIASSIRSLGFAVRPISPKTAVVAEPKTSGCCGPYHGHAAAKAADGHSRHDRDHDHGHEGHDPDRSRTGPVDLHSGHNHAHDPDEGDDTKRWWQKAKGRLVLVLAGVLGAASLMSLTEPAYSRWIFTAAAVAGLIPFSKRAWTMARAGIPFSIETLMTVAAIGALFIDAAEEAAVVVFLFAVGELIEGIAAGSARSGIRSLAKLMPSSAVIEEDGALRTVEAASLRPGQILVVRPGDRVATDGEIVDGTSDIDQSAVTGESAPVVRGPGDAVFAGSVNANATLKVSVTRTVANNTIARIIDEVQNAQSKKAPTARFIDDFSRWYTPAAMGAAALVAIVPPLLLSGDWTTWVYRSLSLLLIACPCALVLSTPAAIASGIAAAARRGLLIKSGAALEALARVKTVAFDKTGTLTAGEPRVTDVIALGASELEVTGLAAAVESASSHPIGRAILERAQAVGVVVAEVAEAAAEPGRGVSGLVAGRRIRVLAPRAAGDRLGAAASAQIADLEHQGKTVVVVADDATALGLIAVRDEPRSDAVKGLAALKAMTVRTLMLTGDNARTANAIADGLGLEARADLMPADKLAAIEALKKDGPIAMVGDGINDAPALAAADVGVAMGGGTEVALSTADVALLGGRVGGVADLIHISRATLGNIHQNVAIALGLKGVFLVTSVLGVTTLWMAILADTGATVLVTANALRLLTLTKAPKD
ncbi:heavy metal translocating P-type ATPase [Methylopila sp. 73B]|uniref:heavy metal translocating P-type ATPase n=1 Tax=Methylopila sp. 73B TaxID=1120792 RepID=UPI0003A88B86|nr:heavy metal translocating P-type ATPase [Methylopila sp. 73B]